MTALDQKSLNLATVEQHSVDNGYSIQDDDVENAIKEQTRKPSAKWLIIIT